MAPLPPPPRHPHKAVKLWRLTAAPAGDEGHLCVHIYTNSIRTHGAPMPRPRPTPTPPLIREVPASCHACTPPRLCTHYLPTESRGDWRLAAPEHRVFITRAIPSISHVYHLRRLCPSPSLPCAVLAASTGRSE
ncbi:hypothetical protein E2C01_084011 [Portunus trituberculatus]|uniref:Uncharacterized protein n=1 Tax=Portunus trituberculatus TaxID=210409 RepID=A0A5B7IYT0_PORTR|nr:hypothetical protein [Portunus trituberculatus]